MKILDNEVLKDIVEETFKGLKVILKEDFNKIKEEVGILEECKSSFEIIENKIVISFLDKSNFKIFLKIEVPFENNLKKKTTTLKGAILKNIKSCMEEKFDEEVVFPIYLEWLSVNVNFNGVVSVLDIYKNDYQFKFIVHNDIKQILS